MTINGKTISYTIYENCIIAIIDGEEVLFYSLTDLINFCKNN